MTEKNIRIHYTFRFDNDQRKDFDLRFRDQPFTLIRNRSATPPAWTELAHHQCRFCPLDAAASPHCPNAVAISDIIGEFSGVMSYDNCVVRCTTAERSYVKRTAVMNGLASLLGLAMAASGCPATVFLGPMARFHLPFSSLEETLMRSASIYLLGEYFAYKRGRTPDLDLKNLHRRYNALQDLNRQMLKRIQPVCDNDCDKNAIFSFHSIAELFSLEIDINLGALAHLFDASADPVSGPETA